MDNKRTNALRVWAKSEQTDPPPQTCPVIDEVLAEIADVVKLERELTRIERGIEDKRDASDLRDVASTLGWLDIKAEMEAIREANGWLRTSYHEATDRVAELTDELSEEIAEAQTAADHACAFALALAVLTWLHGSQDDEWLYCQPPLTDGEW